MIKTQNNVITSAQLFILLFTIKISIIVLDPYIAQKNDLLTDILIPFLIIIIVYSLSLITTYYYDKYNGKTIITPEIYSYIYIIVSGYFCILFLIRMFSFCQCFLSDEIKARGIIYEGNPNRYARQTDRAYFITNNGYLYSNRHELWGERKKDPNAARCRLIKEYRINGIENC